MACAALAALLPWALATGARADDLTALNDSPLGKLKTMVDEAAAQGKDLMRDMIGRLKRDILVATNRLDAIRPPQ